MLSVEKMKRILAAVGAHDGVPAAAKPFGEEVANAFFIVSDQN
jgi:hypothetical protein